MSTAVSLQVGVGLRQRRVGLLQIAVRAFALGVAALEVDRALFAVGRAGRGGHRVPEVGRDDTFTVEQSGERVDLRQQFRASLSFGRQCRCRGGDVLALRRVAVCGL